MYILGSHSPVVS